MRSFQDEILIRAYLKCHGISKLTMNICYCSSDLTLNLRQALRQMRIFRVNGNVSLA